MAEATMKAPTSAIGRFSFHLWMTLLMAFFVFAGFGMTYLMPLAAGTFPSAPPVVHLHGVIFFVWTVLLVTQAVLVNTRNVKLHRSLGMFGIGWAAITAFMGLLITIISVIGPPNPGDSLGFGLMYLSLVAPPSFVALFAMAIRAVRTPAIHRNLILMAMISILMPGINRFYMMSFGLGEVPFYATYLTMDAMVAAVVWHERTVTGSISRATWIGAAIVVLPQFLLPLVAPSPAFADFVNYLGTLVYYR